jgi:hypothetical protein
LVFGTGLAAAMEKVYQLLVHGWRFSLGTLASSTIKTGCHDIAEIFLKVVLSTINQINQSNSVCSRKSKDWMAQNQDNVSEWSDMSAYVMCCCFSEKTLNKSHYRMLV